MAVSRCVPASVALFGLLALPTVLVYGSAAQNNGSSISSSGMGHTATGATPTVAVTPGSVHPPTGPVQPPTGTIPLAPSGSIPGSGITPHVHHDGEHHHHSDTGVGPVFYPVPIPYAVDLGSSNAYADADPEDQDPNYQGGPTVFDRRGSGAGSYVAPVSEIPGMQAADRSPNAASADDPPEPTTLIFKDGHKLSVENYAIVGQMLLDLTPGHTRRVPLSELDLAATRQENDDHGIVFQVPDTTRVN